MAQVQGGGSVMKGDGSLEEYLSANIGKIFLQRRDRKELILKMNVKRNGALSLILEDNQFI